MLYIENIFICLAAPLVIMLFFAPGPGRRSLIGVILGMVACLLSAYVSAFFAQISGADAIATAVEITPVIEEIIKFLPFVFYFVLFDPKDGEAISFACLIGVSFATMENICYLIENGAASISLLVLRGFGTGAMHLACVMLAAYGLVMLRRTTPRTSTRIVGGLSVLCISMAFHEIFNVLLAAGGVVMYIALATPIITCAVLFIRRRIFVRRRMAQGLESEPPTIGLP